MEAEINKIAEWPVAILAGGLATRLRPITEKIPKALIPVAGEPFLAHQIRLLHSAGFRHIVVCAGYLGEMIAAEFGDGTRFDVRIDYSFDGPHLLGTGGALRRALDQLGEKFFVLYGDSYLPIDYQRVADAFIASEKAALMTVFRNDGRWDTSNVWFEAGKILCYNKKKRIPEMLYIDYGVGILSAAVISHFPDKDSFDLANVYHQLATENQLAGHEVMQRFYEIGSPAGLAELDAQLRHQTRRCPI